MSKRIVLVLFFILIVGSLILGAGRAPKPTSTVANHQLAIDFSLSDLEGQKVTLSDFKGKIVFLNFWATWCPPCRREMPSMQFLYEELKGKNFEMLAVSIDRTGKAVVEPFVEKGNYTFKVLLDPEGRVASQYRVVSIPTTFIIDKKGKIIDKVIGARDWADETIVQKIRMFTK